MHSSVRKQSGYLLTFAGLIDAAEMTAWAKEATDLLAHEKEKSFCVIVDMRDLKPLLPDAQAVMVAAQHKFAEKGMTRSSVIVNNPVTVGQFRRLAKESGIYAFERYFDGHAPDALDAAIAWGRDGIDPDA
jgi:hypothetical protein